MKGYFIWLLKLLTLVVVIFLGVPALIGALAAISMGAVSGESERLGGKTDRSVAVLELVGEIHSSKKLIKELHRQIQDESIKGIVLRVDSPGGAVAPSQEIYRAVRALKTKKPIVASMSSTAASGGLYVTLGASKIYAEPGTLTGSIGVIMQVPNFSVVSEKVGVSMVTIKAGKLKDVGNQFRPMTDEERAFLESTVAEVHDDFIQAVVDGRGLPRSQVDQFADGRVLVGSTAKKLGLVDEFGGLYEAGRAVFELRGAPLPEGEYPHFVYPSERFGKFSKYLENMEERLETLLSSRMKLLFIAS